MPVPVLVGSWSTIDGLVGACRAPRATSSRRSGPAGCPSSCRTPRRWPGTSGATRGTVMLRMPLHPVALELLRDVGPMAVSSANVSGAAAGQRRGRGRGQLGDTSRSTSTAGRPASRWPRRSSTSPATCPASCARARSRPPRSPRSSAGSCTRPDPTVSRQGRPRVRQAVGDAVKNRSSSTTTLWVWPNSSKLIRPNRLVQRVDGAGRHGPGGARRQPRPAARPAQDGRVQPGSVARVSTSRPRPVGDDPAQHDADPAGGPDRSPPGPRSRAPASRRPARTRADGPWPSSRTAPHAARQRPSEVASGVVRRRPLRGRAERVVRVDDQGGEQVVAAGEVAVDGRAGHAELPGDGAQRQRGGAVRGELPAGDLGDLPRELGSDPRSDSLVHPSGHDTYPA